jgi:hypothetical protein
MQSGINKSTTKQNNSAFEMETLLAISRDCILPAPMSNTTRAAQLSITQLKHVRRFNQSEKVSLETEMSTLLGALVKAQQSYLTLALAHIDAEQHIWEAFEAAWSNHLMKMADAVQLSLQRGPLSRARG